MGLRDVSPLHVAAYIRTHPGSAPTVTQHLPAILRWGCQHAGVDGASATHGVELAPGSRATCGTAGGRVWRTTDPSPKRQRPRRRRRMASTRSSEFASSVSPSSTARRPPAHATDQQQDRKRDRAGQRQSRHRGQVRDGRSRLGIRLTDPPRSSAPAESARFPRDCGAGRLALGSTFDPAATGARDEVAGEVLVVKSRRLASAQASD